MKELIIPDAIKLGTTLIEEISSYNQAKLHQVTERKRIAAERDKYIARMQTAKEVAIHRISEQTKKEIRSMEMIAPSMLEATMRGNVEMAQMYCHTLLTLAQTDSFGTNYAGYLSSEQDSRSRLESSFF